MTERTTASVASYNPLVCPPDRLFVDELNGSLWPRLGTSDAESNLEVTCAIPALP